jgi:hypothetical protein
LWAPGKLPADPQAGAKGNGAAKDEANWSKLQVPVVQERALRGRGQKRELLADLLLYFRNIPCLQPQNISSSAI